jgi:hypothetical protein
MGFRLPPEILTVIHTLSLACLGGGWKGVDKKAFLVSYFIHFLDCVGLFWKGLWEGGILTTPLKY